MARVLSLIAAGSSKTISSERALEWGRAPSSCIPDDMGVVINSALHHTAISA
jgi:hypothetical protein